MSLRGEFSAFSHVISVRIISLLTDYLAFHGWERSKGSRLATKLLDTFVEPSPLTVPQY